MAKQILPGNDMNSREMIDFLEQMHLDEYIGINTEICPVDIPIARIIAVLYFPPQLLGHLRHHWVLRHYG